MDDAFFFFFPYDLSDWPGKRERAHMVDGNEGEKWQGTQRWGD